MEMDLIREFTGRDGMRMTWYVYSDTLHRRLPYLIALRRGKPLAEDTLSKVSAPLTINRG